MSAASNRPPVRDPSARVAVHADELIALRQWVAHARLRRVRQMSTALAGRNAARQRGRGMA